jgi:hypothetical protein
MGMATDAASCISPACLGKEHRPVDPDSMVPISHIRSCFSANVAALYPHIPCTPPPGGVDDEQR